MRLAIYLRSLFIVPALCAAFSGLAAAASPAGAPEAQLRAALDAFDQALGQASTNSDEARRLFRDAAEGFEAVIQQGVHNGYLYYNAGNARMRLGELGPAIAHYRRAERLLPGDENIRRNLAFARSRCEVQVPSTVTAAFIETVLFWHFDTATRSRTAVALSAYAALWGLLFFSLLRRKRSPTIRSFTGAAGVIALATILSVAWDQSRLSDRTHGVTIADNVVMRKGNGDGYQPQLDRPLPQGVEFQIQEERPDAAGATWLRVKLRDGKEGWIPESRAEII